MNSPKHPTLSFLTFCRRFLASRPSNKFAGLSYFSLFLFVLAPVFPGKVWANNIEQLRAGVVKITAHVEGKRKVGTGFVVRLDKDEAFVVTASHVIEGAQQIEVAFYSQRTRPLPARVIEMEGGDPRGLAALKVHGQLPTDIVVLEWDPTVRMTGGEDVRLIGFPRVAQTPWAVTKGTIAGAKGRDLSFTAPADEGNSGGPLLLRGKVIGVVTEVGGKFGHATPALIAHFTLENWHVLASGPAVQSAQEPAKSSEKAIIAPRAQGLASLTIDSSPPDAEVFVDGEFVGTTSAGPLKVPNLDPDEHEVEVKKDGYASWVDTIEVYPNESRSMMATLRRGGLDITGIWQHVANPALSYVFEQQGRRVTMKEITTNVFGATVTAEGEGELNGNVVQVFYITVLGANGRSTATVSDDGQSMTGSYQDLASGLTYPISLSRSSADQLPFSAPNQGNPFDILR